MTDVTVQTLDELAADINVELHAIQQKAGETLEHARRAGEMLLKAKVVAGHGGFRGWFDEHVEESYSTAARYMRIAERWPELNVSRVTHLSIRDACKLLANTNGGSVEMEIYEPQTQRQHELANGQRRRLERSLSEIDGLCTGLRDVKLPMAFACLTDDERMVWAEMASGHGRQLRALARTLREAL